MSKDKDGKGSDPEKFEIPPSFFPYSEEGETESEKKHELIEVDIEGIYAAESNGSIHRFVLLNDGNKKMSILIGPFEAQSISMVLEGNTPDRPMTHDLLKNVIDRMGVVVSRIVIDDILSTTYYAKIFLAKGDVEDCIDSRPSDAIALAIRYDAPIYVTQAVLDHEID